MRHSLASKLQPAPDEVGCVSPDRTPEELLGLRRQLASEAPRLRRSADEFAILSSETRLKILSLLGQTGELCVCDLATVLDMTPAAVSQHLSRLRAGGLVASRRCGMTIYYRRTDPRGWAVASSYRVLCTATED